MHMTNNQFPDKDMSLTHMIVVSNLATSKKFYVDVLGATVDNEYDGTSVVLRFMDQWILLVTGGEPTKDKPGVALAPPADQKIVHGEMIIGVKDCRAVVEELKKRGAEFLTEPVEYDWEIRAFFRDPDGYLFEITQRKSTT